MTAPDPRTAKKEGRMREDYVPGLIDRLQQIVPNDDHARGCQGREYTCICGYDARKDALIAEAANALAAISPAPAVAPIVDEPPAILEEIEAGMERVTPGPWIARDNVTPNIVGPLGAYVATTMFYYTPIDRLNANTAHIARLSPDNVRLILDYIAALRRKAAPAETADERDELSRRLAEMELDRDRWRDLANQTLSRLLTSLDKKDSAPLSDHPDGGRT